jgi:hypothetical protein
MLVIVLHVSLTLTVPVFGHVVRVAVRDVVGVTKTACAQRTERRAGIESTGWQPVEVVRRHWRKHIWLRDRRWQLVGDG